MILKIIKNELISSLQAIIGIVGRKQTSPILSNVLFVVAQNSITLIASDTEIEITSKINCEGIEENISFTVSGRKLLDIVKLLINENLLTFEIYEDYVLLISSTGKYVLHTLPSEHFPLMNITGVRTRLSIKQNEFKNILERTSFCMANQDIRYYLNGLLCEIRGNVLRLVATDGHRLAISDFTLCEFVSEFEQIIIPRKTVQELVRIFDSDDISIQIDISNKHCSFYIGNVTLITKLIDGRYPDYERVIPQDLNNYILVNRSLLKSSLLRAAVLSNDKYRGVRFTLSKDLLLIRTNNPEQESAEESIYLNYDSIAVSLGFNINYLIEVLSNFNEEQVQLNFKDELSSIILHGENDYSTRYVVMPMRL